MPTDTIIDSVPTSAKETRFSEEHVKRAPESSPANKFVVRQKTFNIGAEDMVKQLDKTAGESPEVDLGPEEKELKVLKQRLDKVRAKTASALGLETNSEEREESNPAKESGPITGKNTAMRQAIESTMLAIDAKNGWVKQKTATDFFEAASVIGFSNYIESDSPLSLSYGVDMWQKPGGQWIAREASFEDSIAICKAMAEFMGNNAHTPKPVELTKENSNGINFKAEFWLGEIAKGYWPVSMVPKSDGTGLEPDKHDARQKHNVANEFLPKSDQDLMTLIAKIDRVRIKEGREPVKVDDENDTLSLIERKNSTRGEKYIDGASIIEGVTDDGDLLDSIDALVTAPKGTLDKRIEDLRAGLDIKGRPIKDLAKMQPVTGHLNFKNYVKRETQGQNLTEEEIRTASDEYLTELHAHILKIRGFN